MRIEPLEDRQDLDEIGAHHPLGGGEIAGPALPQVAFRQRPQRQRIAQGPPRLADDAGAETERIEAGVQRPIVGDEVALDEFLEVEPQRRADVLFPQDALLDLAQPPASPRRWARKVRAAFAALRRASERSAGLAMALSSAPSTSRTAPP